MSTRYAFCFHISYLLSVSLLTCAQVNTRIFLIRPFARVTFESKTGESVPFVVACQRHEVSHPAAQISAITASQLYYTRLLLQNYGFLDQSLNVGN